MERISNTLLWCRNRTLTPMRCQTNYHITGLVLCRDTHDQFTEGLNFHHSSGSVWKSPSIDSAESIQSACLQYWCGRWNRNNGWVCGWFLVLDDLPFFSRRMALLLSWKTIVSLTLYSWSVRKYLVQHIAGMQLTTATSSLSVELLNGKPRPIDKSLSITSNIWAWAPFGLTFNLHSVAAAEAFLM